MDRSRRWCRRRRRCDFRDNNAARLTCDSHGQKLRSRLLRGPADAVLVLVSPLEYLVGVDPVLSRNTRNRRSGNKCRLDDTALLRRCTMNPFRRATDGNLNRLAHKAIVSLITPPVYTARTGRLLERLLGATSYSLLCGTAEKRLCSPSEKVGCAMISEPIAV
jgi:hypothetical protein